MSANAVNVAIAGLGRSGWDIHAKTLEKLKSSFRVVAVTDTRPDRCQEAVQRLGCRAHFDPAALFADPDVELVVIATPSHVHATQVLEALGRGKHVVCEKPMALSAGDADRMIDAAQRADRVLSVFHNMRYWPDFVKVREVCESGKLGRIVQIRLTMHRFTRRWDWQTLREFGGGALFNAGAHLVDLALQLFGPNEPRVTCDLQHTLASGDAEDHAKILLQGGSDGRTIDIEISNACAYPQETWHLMGTSGGLHGTAEQLQWKWLDLSQLPDRPVDRSTAAAERRFNREELPWQEQSWRNDAPEGRDYEAFYHDLHRHIRGGGELVITPQSVRRTLSVLEQCRAAAS
jgi:scyllo-inositol 2-dehydrogenase (NADP+)